MKKLKLLLVAFFICCNISQAQFFKEDFSKINIKYSLTDTFRWGYYSSALLCNGGSWGITTDTNFSYGVYPNIYYGSFNYVGSSNGFAKMGHECDEGPSGVTLVTPALNFLGQNQVVLRFAHVFPGVSIPTIKFINSSGQYSLITNASFSPSTIIDSIDISSFAANTNNVHLAFDLDYYGTPGFSNPERSAWCIDDVTLYNPSCNIQAVVKSATGSNYFCYGDSVELVRENPVGGTSFQWHKNNAIITGATNTNYFATQPGAYSCLITDTCGYVYSNNLVIDTVSSLAPDIVHIGGFDSLFCAGSNNGYLIAYNILHSNTYQWYLNGVPIPGQTGSSLNSQQLGAGSIYTSVTNACGTYNSDTISFVNGNLPTAVITPGVPFPTCYPNQFMLIANDSIGFTHQWYRGIYSLGSAYRNDTLLYSWQWPVNEMFKCIITDTAGCPNQSNTITINAHITPVASANGPTVFCVGDSVLLSSTTVTGYAYQWLKNNLPISTATQSSYYAKTHGNYSINVSDSNCSVNSNSVTVLTPCVRIVRGNIALRSLNVINENQNNIYIESVSAIKQIKVYNLMGQVVFQMKANDYSLNLNIQNIKQGIYVVTVDSEESQDSFKISVR